MDKQEVQSYRQLKDSGVDLQKQNQIRFNSGSETIPHLCCKAIAAHIAHANGYRVSSEVEVPNGEIDLVIWGHDSRLSYAVEVETSPTQETIDSKVDRYVHQTPIDDIIIIKPNNVPNDMVDATEFIANEMGLDM